MAELRCYILGMTLPEFDANERIAGFSMTSIKGVLALVGLLDDRDDVDQVAKTLKCPQPQATRVLQELESRGFVEKTPKKRQWTKTEKGRQLAYYWHPPRRFTPAIERPDEPETYSRGCATVPCSIWRAAPDDEQMFEEGELDVGMHVEFEGERLVEINIVQPDEYQGDHAGSSLIESSVYLSLEEAKKFLAGLQEAIDHTERELARRAAVGPVKHEDDGEDEHENPSSGAVAAATPPADGAQSGASARRRNATSSALAELREINRARLAGSGGKGRQ